MSREPVEHVGSERVPRGELGVQEILGGIVMHPQALHHTARARVPGGGVSDDLLERQLVEAIGERRARGLAGEPPSPVALPQAPADLVVRAKGSSAPVAWRPTKPMKDASRGISTAQRP